MARPKKAGRETMEQENPKNPKESKLEDLDGIGTTRANNMRKYGIQTPLDLVIWDAEELSVVSEMKREDCSHLVEKVKEQLRANGTIPKTDWDSRDKWEANIQRFTTGSKEIDDMLGGLDENDNQITGGIETQALTEFYGAEGGGKTQSSLTICAEALGKGHGVYFMDCEGTFDKTRFKTICKMRGLNPDWSKFFIETALDSDGIMHLVNNMPKFILDHDIKIIVIDGAVGVFRAEFQQGRGDLNARQNKLKPFFLHLKKMAYFLNVAVLITNQVMDNPDPYAVDKIKAVGGHITGHAPKYILWFKVNGKNKRTVTFKKSNRHAMYDVVIYLTKAGISDTPEVEAVEPTGKVKVFGSVDQSKQEEPIISEKGLIDNSLLE